MESITTLKLPGDIQITVPDSMGLITTYVLHEQQDWFEDEVKFVRNILSDGQCVIDIGANYGVYTLTMASLVGATGKVWSFEPASSTASLLAKSIASNNFEHVVLEQMALSNKNGSAELSLHENSELNSIVREGEPGVRTENVPINTLDDYAKNNGLKNIDFIKLDAEGEEENILKGAEEFLNAESPLIQYEVKASKELHLELIRAFSALGYQSYRLVPGLNVLAPFDDQPVDNYLLNLFACKADRAALLSDSGLIVDTNGIKDAELINARSAKSDDHNDWLNKLIDLPYGQLCKSEWQQSANRNNSDVCQALGDYFKSKDELLTPAQRYVSLRESFFKLKSVCETQPEFLRLFSLARVAREYGARSVAVKALGQLSSTIFQHKRVDAREPFLAPGERFDLVSPRNDIAKWAAAAVLEELELLAAFSSFYSGKNALQRLRVINGLGFASVEMVRRLEMVEQRFEMAESLQ